jgi:thiol:disulfide interchange protein
MRNILILLLALPSLSFTTKTDQIEFFHGSLKEAKVLAAKEGKPIFIDCFTEWCGPCKVMTRRVFTDPKVAKYYNEHFINLKIDMEKGEGVFLSRKFQIQYYPTLIYLNKDGQEVHRVVGYRNGDDFLSEGKSAHTK